MSDRRRAVHFGFALAFLSSACLSLVGVCRVGGILVAYQRPLETKDLAPRGLSSLGLAASPGRAERILDDWARSTPSRLFAARQAVAIDDAFVPVYTWFLLSLALLACAAAYLGAPWRARLSRERWGPLAHTAGLVVATLALAAVDLAENRHLDRILESRVAGAGPVHDLGTLRLLSQLKFTLLTVVALGVLLALGVGARRVWRWRAGVTPAAPAPGVMAGSFTDVVREEQRGILGLGAQDVVAVGVRPEAAGEPWVHECREDLVGLALSGGGIRSATFNLGLLQGLHRLKLLRHVDYLATVSGGGYVGGFWSRWLAEKAPAPEAREEIFPDQFEEPDQSFSGDSRVFEAREVRHLREFGKFLVPRVGVFDTETWGAIVAVLASVGPAVVTALSVLGLSLITWLVLTFYLACPEPWARVLFAVGLTAVVLLAMEWWWVADPTGDHGPAHARRVALFSALALVLVGGLAWYGVPRWPTAVYGYDRNGLQWVWSPGGSAYDDWWRVLGIVAPDSALVVSPRLYEPSVMWAIAAGVLILFRFRGAFAPPSMSRRVLLPASDRTAMRLLGLATLWLTVATFWHIGLNLFRLDLVAPVAAGTAASGGLFALLRNWIGRNLARPHRASWWEWIKPYVPQVLAYVTVGLAWALTAGILIRWAHDDWLAWNGAAFAMGAVVLLVLLVDPAEFGMHAFYRDRIRRAYLGAADPQAYDDPRPVAPADGLGGAAAQAGRALAEGVARNRQTDLRRNDDVPLARLPRRPLHLVCCAANDLGGDPLATLSRGARSAVLSRYGAVSGDRWASRPEIELGSALTASAAAFNSNMGSVSMRVGPAVSFLMCALNLRLGLWIPKPGGEPVGSIGERLFPGWLFYREMAAWTVSDGRDLHLSDGAHFENLGLYELVRRHCRFVIVSDCTADPDVAFDDFGNTARRIREDFGVEIDVDLDPLKPGAEGHARQHAVVGRIDYGRFDKGVLVYVKPTLTGDEPPDMRQYKTRNRAFPHESTGDQFYDEAQWESYRRLGVHTVREVFGAAERVPEGENRPQAVFAMVAEAWHPAPPGLVERILQMSTRFAQLEEELKVPLPAGMLREVFPELADLAPPPGRAPAFTQDDELANIGHLLKVMTLMEDAILACALTTHWNHPLNLGWINTFARWATAPTFRRWWPFLKSLYGPDLRTFLEDRFVVLRESPPVGARVIETWPHASGLALTWWRERDRPPDLAGKRLFEYRIEVPGRDGAAVVEVQVGLVALRIDRGVASWSSDDFFVPQSLWGGGLGSGFLRALLRHLAGPAGAVRCEVKVKGPEEGTADFAQWEERRGFVRFYRQAGFRLEQVEDDPAQAPGAGSAPARVALLAQDLDPEALAGPRDRPLAEDRPAGG